MKRIKHVALLIESSREFGRALLRGVTRFHHEHANRSIYKRIHVIDVALLGQDTTEIDLTRPKQQVQGAGPMDSDARRVLSPHARLRHASYQFGNRGRAELDSQLHQPRIQTRKKQKAKANSDPGERELSLDQGAEGPGLEAVSTPWLLYRSPNSTNIVL